MNIRDAIYRAKESGKIRLGKREISTSQLCEVEYENGGQIFTYEELTSLDWEAQTIDWVKDKDL